jgi:hypothetical protein
MGHEALGERIQSLIFISALTRTEVGHELPGPERTLAL